MYSYSSYTNILLFLYSAILHLKNKTCQSQFQEQLEETEKGVVCKAHAMADLNFEEHIEGDASEADILKLKGSVFAYGPFVRRLSLRGNNVKVIPEEFIANFFRLRHLTVTNMSQ